MLTGSSKDVFIASLYFMFISLDIMDRLTDLCLSSTPSV